MSDNKFKLTLTFRSPRWGLGDLHRKFVKIAGLLELELLSTDLVIMPDVDVPWSRRTPKALAAVWGYVEQWPDTRKAINVQIMADELGMAKITARNNLELLLGNNYRLVSKRKMSKQCAYGRSVNQYVKNTHPNARLTDHLAKFPLAESNWEPKVKTWEKESPALRKSKKYGF